MDDAKIEIDKLTKELQQRKLQKQIIEGIAQGKRSFAELFGHCGLKRDDREADRNLDREIQRLRRRGLIEYNRRTAEWEFTLYYQLNKQAATPGHALGEE